MRDHYDTRERLIDAAHRLALRKGFDRTSVREVIAEAGVQRGSLYHFFPGKNDLGLAVLERDRAAFFAMLDTTLSAPGDPASALRSFFEAALKKHRESGFVGGCLWGNTALEMSDTNPAFAQVVAKVFEEWIARLERVVEQGQGAGMFRADLSPADLARMIVAAVEGGILLSRLGKTAMPMKVCLETVTLCVLNKKEGS